jgi:hypothetical protein
MAHTDPFEALREWVRRECQSLRQSIAQQLRRLREASRKS